MKKILEPILVILVLGIITVAAGKFTQHSKPIISYNYKVSLPGDIFSVREFPEIPDTLIAIRIGDTIYIKFKPYPLTDSSFSGAEDWREDEEDLSSKFTHHARFTQVSGGGELFHRKIPVRHSIHHLQYKESLGSLPQVPQSFIPNRWGRRLVTRVHAGHNRGRTGT